MFWTFTFTNPREQAKMSKNQFSQIHNSVTHCVATHAVNKSQFQEWEDRKFPQHLAAEPLHQDLPRWHDSLQHQVWILLNKSTFFEMEVFECLPYIMEHQWYIWTVPENNSCPQKAFWNTFLSCLFLKINFFPGTHISTYISLYDIFKSGPDQSRDIQTPFSVGKVEA